MIYTLDRFEGNYAVLVSDKKGNISVLTERLTPNAKIGNVFKSENETDFVFLKDETEKRHKNALSLHRSLFDKAKKNK